MKKQKTHHHLILIKKLEKDKGDGKTLG